MPKYSFPQSVRKHIRLQKALIRRQVFDALEQKQRISKLYEDMIQRYQVKGVKESVTPVIPVKPLEPVDLKKDK